MILLNIFGNKNTYNEYDILINSLANITSTLTDMPFPTERSKKMTIFDLSPDIEELIQDELDVLLKFREATKELKHRMKLSSKSIREYDKMVNLREHREESTWTDRVGMPRILIKVLFPYVGKTLDTNKYNATFKNVEHPNIHGFLYDWKWSRYNGTKKFIYNWPYWGRASADWEHGGLSSRSIPYPGLSGKNYNDKIKLLMQY